MIRQKSQEPGEKWKACHEQALSASNGEKYRLPSATSCLGGEAVVP